MKPTFEHASESFKRLNPEIFGDQAGDSGIRATEPECIKGVSLVSAAQREEAGSTGIARRFLVRFRVFSVRPLDWDNYRLKDLQDLLCIVGLIPSDDWKTLQGEVISEKAYSKKEERTEVIIEPI